MADKQTLPQAKFDEIKKRAADIVAAQAKVKLMFKDLADMYWIAETKVGAGNSSLAVNYNREAFDPDDVRVTASTSSRDRVTGLHRMIRTSKPQFSVTCSNQNYADKIEKCLIRWWDASNERRRAKLESELALSGILFADENLAVTAVDDLINTDGIPKIRKARLQKLITKTPIIFEIESPMVVYPVWGEDGLSEYLVQSKITGRQLKERWGVTDPGVKDNASYTLSDYYDLEFVATWYDRGNTQLRGGEHGLPDIPRFSSVADGTDLFPEPERQRQPFLYGMWKSGLAKREDELLTALMTSVFARGTGPLIVIDKSQPNYNPQDIEIIYKGLARILAAPGRPQLADDKAFDSNLIQLSQMLQQVGERTTISTQTLGENIASGTPYSGYAMASQNGRIPIIPIQEATEKVIHDACTYVLTCIREGFIITDQLKASEVTEDVDLTVKLEVDLPQDALRNAQVLNNLTQGGTPLSIEWKHNFLQIKDSKKMIFDTWSEQAAQTAFQQDLPNLVQQLMAMFQPKPPQPAPGQPPGMEGMEQPPMEGQLPPEAMGENAQYANMVGGPEAAKAGGEVMPATEPIDIQQAMKGRA